MSNIETYNQTNYNSDTDLESYYDSDESYYNSDSEETNYNFYNPEEVSLTKYNIVICERYSLRYHHLISTSEINYHYLTHFRFKKYRYNEMKNIIRTLLPRSTIEIAECFYLNEGFCVSILKTIWIKLIQRKWKNILKKRKNIIKKRCNLNTLKYREINGFWPRDCLNYPTLKGMLSDLSRASSRASFRT